MAKIAVVRSSHLLQSEGQDLRGYNLSHHKEAVKRVMDTLQAFGIPYLLLDESELGRTDLLVQHDVEVIIAPGLRVCAEETFQRLIDLAEQGWVVFSGVSSFYYRPSESGPPKRVMRRKIRELFQLSHTTHIESRKLVHGSLEFNPTSFQWLTKRMPTRMRCRNKWILALLRGSPMPTSHGDILAENPQNASGQVDEELKGKILPAFLIREYPAGGMFIYACFVPRLLENSKQIYRNLWEFRSEPRSGVSQIRVLKILVLVLAAGVGLLLARVAIGDTSLVYLGGIVSGLIVGVIGNKLTDFTERWLSDQ